MTPLERVSADVARAAIAAAVLETEVPDAVGSVSLWPRQRSTLSRVLAALGECGGALLADDVGTGKTFVALAAATHFRAPLIVAPAALRDTWDRATARAGVVAPFYSIESLSRGIEPRSGASADLVIVDEAHHVRNPATRRYEALARLTAHTSVLLLTATPIHNGRRDLDALLALFLGGRAYHLGDAAVARCVIRGDIRSKADRPGVPRVDGPLPLALDHDDAAIAERIVALPAAIPPADGGIAHALSRLGLLRQWSSSDGALRAALRRRLMSGQALADALATGRRPSRRELALWTLGDDAQQLAFAELLLPGDAEGNACGDLRDPLARHVDALRELLDECRRRPSPDIARADALRALWQEHPQEKVIAFTQFAETAASYWAHLRGLPHVAMLTARGGIVAGGAIARRAALERFAPRSLGVRAARRAERIDCLITTDILSEGLDLQDASIIVHLDRPWTPARLEQRVGRLARPGAAHERILVRVMPPPARADVVLDMETRLRAKLDAARSSLGDVLSSALGNPAPVSGSSPVTASSLTADRLTRWTRLVDPAGCPVVGIVRAPVRGWLAVRDRGGRAGLIARVGEAVGEDPRILARACELAEGPDSADGSEIGGALDEIERWMSADAAARAAGVADLPAVPSRSPLARAASAVARLPRSSRAELAARADAARALAAARSGVGHERELAQLAMDGITRLPPEVSSRPPEIFEAGGAGEIVALIVFSPAGQGFVPPLAPSAGAR